MKIGFVYENGFASNNGSNHLLCSTIEKMLDRGHSVELIEAVSVKDNPDYPKQLERPGFKCHVVKLPITKKTNFIGRYIYGLRFAYAVKRLAKDLDVDLFFVQSVPTVSFTIRNLKKLRKPIVYNIHDVFPGSAYELGIVRTKILNQAFKIIQRIGFNLADRVVVVSDDMRDKLIEEKTSKDKIFVVNTWYDSDSIHIVDNKYNSFIKENSIDTSKIIIQYAGNVGQVFGLEEFVKIVNGLKSNKQVEFHIIGSGVKLDELKKRTKGSNIRFFDWQPQERMSEIYSYCDVEIIPLHHGVIGNNVPSKMALAMACGKPVMNIVEKSNYYNQFRNNNIGFSFSQDDIDEAIKTINGFSKASLGEYHKRVIDFNNKAYSKDRNNDRLLDMLEELQGGFENNGAV